jgi:hypothetical protein
MTVHTVRVVASSTGRNFIADDDGVVLAESAHQLNAAAATLLDRHWARPSHTILAYLGEALVMGANVGWISGAERWSTDGVMMTYRRLGHVAAMVLVLAVVATSVAGKTIAMPELIYKAGCPGNIITSVRFSTGESRTASFAG